MSAAAVATGETSLATARPYRPRAIAALNSFLARRGRAARLDVDELVAAARRRSGLSDFGDESFREPLTVLCTSIDDEARLHPVGAMITKTRLVGALATRLRVHRYLADHPEAREIELEPPVVIAGLQRTGTTMLHRLMASDPQLRPVLSWEGLDPVPGGRSLLATDPRIYRARFGEKALAYMAPAFFAIHPAEADAPEEDVLLLDYAFMSTTPEATLHVPTYAAWLEAQDHTEAYCYFALLLRVLAHQHGPRRFVLKTPHHLEYLDVLRRVFPGVRVVQTHRDPTRTLASFCSMVWHGRGIFSDDVDAREVGAHWSRKIGRMLERSLDVREAAADEGFVDVSYYDLIGDPLPTVQALYDRLGLPFTTPVRGRMQTTREGNPQHKYGTHRYSLGDFGLSAAGIEPLLARYRQRFGVRHEGSAG
ncbi:MAG TPA: sulfotransferase [Candidatus Binatia bacterium]|jgi:hypothetical protein